MLWPAVGERAVGTSTGKLWLLAGREDSEETSTGKLWLLAGREDSEGLSTSKPWPAGENRQKHKGRTQSINPGQNLIDPG